MVPGSGGPGYLVEMWTQIEGLDSGDGEASRKGGERRVFLHE